MPASNTIINKEALLPLSLVAVPLGFAFWLGSHLTRLDGRLIRIEEALNEIAQESVSSRDFALWQAKLKARNPELHIPELP